MPEIRMDEREVLYKSSQPQRVSENGVVSVGRANKGKYVYVYVVEKK